MFENGDTPVKIKPPEKKGFDYEKVRDLLISIARRIRTVVDIPDEVEPNEDLEILVPSKVKDEVIAEINAQGYQVI
ncbi:hypothetical protein ACFL3T_04575 [Patescibacteria group bacterium]